MSISWPVSAALAALFFYPVFSGEATFYFRDIHRWFYPMKHFLAESFRSGDLPFWCSRYFCGAPMLSDIQSGVFYPPSVLFALLPFPLSFNLFICSHFVLAVVFCYRFLKSSGRSTGAALFAATAYGYGGFLIASVNTLNNLTTAVWLPAVLWAAHPTAAGRPSSGRLLAVLVLAILGGEPQLFLMIAGVLFMYAVVARAGGSWRAAAGRGARIAALGAMATLIAMVQLGPTWLDFSLSARASGFDYEMATRGSLPFEALGHLFLPLRFAPGFTLDPATLTGFFPAGGALPWLLTIYPGFLIAPLAILAMATDGSRSTRFWAILTGIAIVLALGRHTPVYSWFYRVFPFFRFPEKFMSIAGFGLVVLSAAGMDRLTAVGAPRRIRPGLVCGLLFIVLVADLYAAHGHLNPVWDSRYYHRYHPNLAPVFEDPGTFRVFVDPEMGPPPGAKGRVDAHHARWQLLQLPNLGIVSGIDHVDGTSGMELNYQWLIHEILRRPWPERIAWLRLANVKYIVSDKPLERAAGLEGRVERINALLWRLTDPLPRAWLVGRLRPPSTNAIHELTATGLDPAGTALIEGETDGRLATAAFTAVDAIDYPGPGTIRVALAAPAPAVLVLSESFYPGWTVRVDGGAPVVPLRLNGLFQGVALEAGPHSVTFVYRPPHFALFAGISLAAIAGSLLIWGVKWPIFGIRARN